MKIKVTVDKQGSVHFADATSQKLFRYFFPDGLIAKDGNVISIEHLALFEEVCDYCPDASKFELEIHLKPNSKNIIVKPATIHQEVVGKRCKDAKWLELWKGCPKESGDDCIHAEEIAAYKSINGFNTIVFNYRPSDEEFLSAVEKFRGKVKKIQFGSYDVTYSYDYEHSELVVPELSQPIIDFINSEGNLDVTVVFPIDAIDVQSPDTWGLLDGVQFHTITVLDINAFRLRVDSDVEFFKQLARDGYVFSYPNVYLLGNARHINELERVKRIFDAGYNYIYAAAGIASLGDGSVLFIDRNTDAQGQVVDVDVIQAYSTVRNSGQFTRVGVSASSFTRAQEYLAIGVDWITSPSPAGSFSYSPADKKLAVNHSVDLPGEEDGFATLIDTILEYGEIEELRIEESHVTVKDGVIYGLVPRAYFDYLSQKLGVTKLIDDANGLVFENGELTNVCKAPSSLVHEAAKLLDARIDLRKAACQLDPELFKDVKLIADRSYFDRVDNPFDKNIVAVGDYAVTDSLTKAAYLAYGIVLVPQGENLLPGDAHLLEVAQTLANEQGIDVKAALVGILGGGYIAVYESDFGKIVVNHADAADVREAYVEDGVLYKRTGLYMYDGESLTVVDALPEPDGAREQLQEALGENSWLAPRIAYIFAVGRVVHIKKNSTIKDGRLHVGLDESEPIIMDVDEDSDMASDDALTISINDDGINVAVADDVDEDVEYVALELSDGIYRYGDLQVVDDTIAHLKAQGRLTYGYPLIDGEPALYVKTGGTLYRRSDIPVGDDEGIPFVLYRQTPMPDGGVEISYTAYDGYSKDITDEFFTTTIGEYFLHKELG